MAAPWVRRGELIRPLPQVRLVDRSLVGKNILPELFAQLRRLGIEVPRHDVRFLAPRVVRDDKVMAHQRHPVIAHRLRQQRIGLGARRTLQVLEDHQRNPLPAGGCSALVSPAHAAEAIIATTAITATIFVFIILVSLDL